MREIVLFDTSVGSMNLGDEIIMELLEKNLQDILEGNRCMRMPTHTPCFLFYQQFKKNPRYRFVRDAPFKFVCGTNILNNKMFFPWPFWNINIFNIGCYKKSILVGVGTSGLKDGVDTMSCYARLLYSSFLSRSFKHSVRDERTKRVIENFLGKGSAINTGCPTLWKLTPEHCRQIPEKKADNVVFTLSDYSRDPLTDQTLIDVLLAGYQKVYFFPQGTRDYLYLQSLKNTDRVSVISPSIRCFSQLLSSGDIDYVGTRLHAGIYAMNHKVRSIILIVDNRVADMTETYSLNTIRREKEGETLMNFIQSSFPTNVGIDEERIQMWKDQFKGLSAN